MELEKRPTTRARVIRSGTYEVDVEAGELRHNGLRVPLQDLPFKILLMLLARRGALVTREELQTELWGPHPEIDAELGLNTAVKKLRVAFRDTADNPRFIETLPKRGYRFIAPVTDQGGGRAACTEGDLVVNQTERLPDPEESDGRPREAAAPDAERSTSPPSAMRPFWHRGFAWLAASILLVGTAGLLDAWIPTVGSSTSFAGAGAPRFETVYRVNGELDGPRDGIGGYNLKSPWDQAFSFDYDHSGKLDHLVFYRPGIGFFWIVQHVGGRFLPIYQSVGIGNEDLGVSTDRVFAFDYDHSGKLDHLVVFRRGAGVLRILENDGFGLFKSVYPPAAEDRSAQPGEPPILADQVIAFDYDHSGKVDHLLFYQSGQGIVGVWTNVGGRLSRVGQRSVQSPTNALAPTASEQVFAFDYYHSGKLDHLVVYRPGNGAVSILSNTNGSFTPVYQGQGIGGFDLKSVNDRMLAVDYEGSGKLDHLLLYRPGAGVAAIFRNNHGIFTPIFQGQGLGGYDLMSINDRALAIDYDGNGKQDHLLLSRPGAGVARIVRLR